jgi:hypothetical protein
MMDQEEGMQKELKRFSPDFPDKTEYEVPEGYFDRLPDQVIKKWNADQAQLKAKRLALRRIISIAALITGLCGGLFWWLNSGLETHQAEIDSARGPRW